MTRITKSILAILPLIHLIVGCATTARECDPRRADFFRNTSCLTSGAYEQRQLQLRRELVREQQRNREFRTVLAALEAEKSGVRAGLGTRQSQYERLDQAWEDLRSDLKQAHARNSALERQIASIDEQMARRKSTGPKEVERKIREREALQRRLSLLQREVDAGVYE